MLLYFAGKWCRLRYYSTSSWKILYFIGDTGFYIPNGCTSTSTVFIMSTSSRRGKWAGRVMVLAETGHILVRLKQAGWIYPQPFYSFLVLVNWDWCFIYDWETILLNIFESRNKRLARLYNNTQSPFTNAFSYGWLSTWLTCSPFS